MPQEWRRAIVNLGWVVTATIVVLALYWARSVLIPIALAVLITFILSPLVVRLQHHGLGRTAAVGTTLLLAALFITGIGALVSNQLSQLAETLPSRRQAIKEKVAAAKRSLVGDGDSPFGQLLNDVAEVISPEPPSNEVMLVKPASPSFATQAEKYLGPAAELMGQAAFTGVLVIFMLHRREDLRNRAIRLLGDRVMTTTRAVDDASQRISRYLSRQLLVNSAFGLVIGGGLFLLGVKYSLLWGFLSGLLRYVPYIGTWIAVIPPFLLSLTSAANWGGVWGQPLAVLGLYAFLEITCANFLEPYVYGKSMGASEVAQLVSAALWAFLWGPIGLILSGPLTVCLLVLGRYVDGFRFLVILLGDEPPLSPRLAFYQRLLAKDQDEASEVAMEMARKDGPDKAFDELLAPALSLARRDSVAGDLDGNDLNAIINSVREIADEIDALREAPAEVHIDAARILVCPARDKTDSVAVQLLALSLDSHRWEVKFAGDEILASELVEMIAAFRPAVVVIGTVPPGGRSHARYLMARVRHRFPEQRMLIGRWGAEDEEPPPPGEAIRESDGIDRTLADTRKRLASLHPALVSESAEAMAAAV